MKKIDIEIDYQICVNIIETMFCILTKSTDHGIVRFHTVPFVLRPYQKQLLKDLFNTMKAGKYVQIEKSTQMGISWLMCALITVFLLFGKNEMMIILGKKEDFIDKTMKRGQHNPNTLMGKIKFMLANLRDKGMKGYAQKYIRTKFLHIQNTLFENILDGESSNADASRGGSYTKAFWDEAAFTDNSEDVLSALTSGDRSGWLCMFSSVNLRNPNNAFYKNRCAIQSGEIADAWRILRVHWSSYFDKAWYEFQCKKLGNDPLRIAQELDINYDGPKNGLIFYNFNDTNYADVRFDNAIRNSTVLSFDFGISDLTTGVVIQYRWNARDSKHEFYVVDSFVLFNVPFRLIWNAILETDKNKLAFFMMEIEASTKPKYFETFRRFMEGHNTHRYHHTNITGDPSAKNRSIESGRGIADLIEQDNHFHYWVNPIGDKEDDILSCIRGWQPNIKINNELTEMRDMIGGWQYDMNKDDVPIRVGHNEHSHLGDAFKYGMNWYIEELFGGVTMYFAKN
jgi:hypothetical protein